MMEFTRLFVVILVLTGSMLGEAKHLYQPDQNNNHQPTTKCKVLENTTAVLDWTYLMHVANPWFRLIYTTHNITKELMHYENGKLTKLPSDQRNRLELAQTTDNAEISLAAVTQKDAGLYEAKVSDIDNHKESDISISDGIHLIVIPVSSLCFNVTIQLDNDLIFPVCVGTNGTNTVLGKIDVVVPDHREPEVTVQMGFAAPEPCVKIGRVDADDLTQNKASACISKDREKINRYKRTVALFHDSGNRANITVDVDFDVQNLEAVRIILPVNLIKFNPEKDFKDPDDPEDPPQTTDNPDRGFRTTMSTWKTVCGTLIFSLIKYLNLTR